MAELILKKGGGRELKKGGPWIYDNEIDRVDGTFAPGDLVSVHDFDGYDLGVGFYNPASAIAVRMMSRTPGAVINRDFLARRVFDAVEYRSRVIDMSSCRLIFGEADYLPGLVVDKFEDILVVQSLALGIDRMKETILDLLKEELTRRGFAVRGIYERSDAKVRLKEGLPLAEGFLGPEFETKVEIRENDVRYLVDIAEGQKTGFFLDQKLNRKAIWPLCRGAKVLDCFTHTGSFALNAGKAGAREVLAVDASALAIRQAEENARLNGLQDTVRFQTADVFELLPELEKAGEQYDVVILDPPAFTKSRSSVKNAVKGYKEINLRGMKLVKNGGFLATCSCSHFMTPDLFSDTIKAAARDAHKILRQVEYRTQAPDHPFLWTAEESLYLKFFIFQVCERV